MVLGEIPLMFQLAVSRLAQAATNSILSWPSLEFPSSSATVVVTKIIHTAATQVCLGRFGITDLFVEVRLCYSACVSDYDET